ncbi:MAG: hypothetical protein LC777_17020 [Actinobacteria bacterium]|nr:hypothetical protein [Actinomycetota bacterium]
MKAHPDLRNADLILRAVEHPLKPFDHDRFMVLAAEELRNLDEGHRRKLREVIEDQRAAGKIKQRHVRWATSERLLRLMAR